MFNEQQRNFIQQYVLANKDKFPYYIAYTNTNISGQGSYDDYNFFIILSNKPITAVDGYHYQLQGTVKRVGVKSGNASYNFHTERVHQLSSVNEIEFNSYEFCYTNAEFTGYSLQPDLLIPVGVEQSHFDGFSIILLITIASVLFFKMIRKGSGGIGKL